jgi:hypothetical protein
MKVFVVSTTSTTFFPFLAVAEARAVAAKAAGGAPPVTSATEATAPATFPRC